jgi:multiple sugar transport system ATP-binding protein
VLRKGELQQVDTPETLYERPVNIFVAGFIGSPAMNFIPGTLRRSRDDLLVEFADGSRLPAPARAGGADGQPVIYGVRPEHLALDGPGGIASEVAVVEPTGANTEVYSRFCNTDINAIFRERHDFRPGDVIRLTPDHARTHLFDAATGEALRRLH